MASDLQEDRQLLIAAQADPSAFRFIVTRHYDPIFRYSALRTGDAREAEALATDIFAHALTALPRYRWDGRPLLAWLFAVARTRPVPAARPHPAAPEHDLTDAPLAAACRDARRLLGRLDGPTAEALVLHFVAGWSFDEIAALQGAPPATVKLRGYRAMVRVRRVMEFGDEG